MGGFLGSVFEGIGGLLGSASKGLGSGAIHNDFRSVNQGLTGDAERQQRFAAAIQAAQARQAPQINGAPQSQFRDSQMGLAQQLQQTAQGNGPDVAGSLYNRAQSQNIAQQNAMASSARGDVNPAMLQRMAMQNASNNNQGLAESAGIMHQQQALNAQGQLGQVLGQGRQQDIGMAGENANLALQGQAQNDKTAMGYEGMGLQGAEANQNANLASDKINADVTNQNVQGQNKIAGGALSGISSAGAAAAMAAHGGLIPGHAQVHGDNLANDKVPTMLSPGEVVIPRTMVHNPEHMAAFVKALRDQAQQGQPTMGYGAVLAARRGMN